MYRWKYWNRNQFRFLNINKSILVQFRIYSSFNGSGFWLHGSGSKCCTGNFVQPNIAKENKKISITWFLRIFSVFLFLKSIWGGPEPDTEPVSDPAQSQCRIQLGASVGSCSEPVSDLEPQFLLLNLLPVVLPNYFRFNQKPVIQYWDSGKKNIFLIA